MPDYTEASLLRFLLNGDSFEQQRLSSTSIFYGAREIAATTNFLYQNMVSLYPVSTPTIMTLPTDIYLNVSTTGAKVNPSMYNVAYVDSSSFFGMGRADASTSAAATQTLMDQNSPYENIILSSLLFSCLDQNDIVQASSATIDYVGTWTSNTTFYSGGRQSNTNNATATTTASTFSKPFRYICVIIITGSSTSSVDIRVDGVIRSSLRHAASTGVSCYPLIIDMGVEGNYIIEVRNLSGNTIFFMGICTWRYGEPQRRTIALKPIITQDQYGSTFNQTRNESISKSIYECCRELQTYGLYIAYYDSRFPLNGSHDTTTTVALGSRHSRMISQDTIKNALSA